MHEMSGEFVITALYPRRQITSSLIGLALLISLPGRVIGQPARASTQETPEAHMGKGYDALKSDRYDVAVTEFQAALRLNPNLVLRARFPLAVAFFELH